MAEYIDRDALLKHKRHISLDRYEIECIVDVDRIIEAPAADVAPVVHGKWIHNDDWWEFICTNCHKGIGNIQKYKYCPNCGAKMDLEE